MATKDETALRRQNAIIIDRARAGAFLPPAGRGMSRIADPVVVVPSKMTRSSPDDIAASSAAIALARANAFTPPAGRGMSYVPPVSLVQGPVTQDVPAPSAARLMRAMTPSAAAPGAGLLDRASAFLQTSFPGINAARVATAQGVSDSVAAGDPLRAAGNVVGGIGRYAVGAAGDLVARPLAADDALGNAVMGPGGVQSFIGGLFGSKGSTAAGVKAAAAVSPTTRKQQVDAAIAAGADPRSGTAVTQAMMQGRMAEATPITAQDALSQTIAQALQGGATFNEIKGLGELIPATVKQGQTSKDKVVGAAASAVDATYKADLAAATKIAPGPAQDTAIANATSKYANYLATLAGANMSGLALQGLQEPE